MKSASRFDNQESLTVPDNQILAIVMDADAAREMVEAFHQNGFSSDEVGVLTGSEGAEKFDAATGKNGFWAKLATSGVEMGDRDTDYIKQYRRALLNGRSVIGVVAKSDETRKKARKIFKDGGARFVTYFGTFVTEVLEA